MRPKRILVPTDFSKGARVAFGLGARLAQELGAELHVLHVVVLFADDPHDPRSSFPEDEAVYRRLEASASDALRELAADRVATDLVVRQVQRYAVAPAPEILAYARDHEIDLIVLGTHGRRGMRRFLLGSVAEEVVRTAACSVLTVHGEDDSSPAAFERILVAYDFSGDADRALATARNLAARYGGTIDLIHVIAPPMDPDVYVPLHDPQRSFSYVELEDEVRARLEERFAGADQPVPITIHVRAGHPAEEIVELAEAIEADLVAVGCRGRTGLKRFFLGSVSERVVRTARCPVLTVHPEAEGASAS